MPRIRTIKPEYAKSKDVAKCSLAARYFFLALWPELDDKGRILYTAKRLSGEMYPHDDGCDGHGLVDARDVAGWVKECCDAGLLVHYRFGGTEYLWAVKFLIHQKIERPSPSRLPSPYWDGVESVSGDIPSGDSPNDSAIREGQFDESSPLIHRNGQCDSPNPPEQFTEPSPKNAKDSPKGPAQITEASPKTKAKITEASPKPHRGFGAPRARALDRGPGTGDRRIVGPRSLEQGPKTGEGVGGGDPPDRLDGPNGGISSSPALPGRTAEELARIQEDIRKRKSAEVTLADDPVITKRGGA